MTRNANPRQLGFQITKQGLLDYPAEVQNLQFSPDGKFLAVMIRDGTVHLTRWISSADGRRLYAGVAGNTPLLEVWEFDNGIAALPTRHLDIETGSKGYRAIDITRDGSWLATSAQVEEARIWRLPGLTDVATLPIPFNEEIDNLRFSHDGSLLATARRPPSVILWDTGTWTPVSTLSHSMVVEHISWAPDDSRLASSDLNVTTKTWDPVCKQPVATFRGTVAEFSPDGVTLAIACQGSQYVGNEEHLGRVVLHHAPPLEEIDGQQAFLSAFDLGW